MKYLLFKENLSAEIMVKCVTSATSRGNKYAGSVVPDVPSTRGTRVEGYFRKAVVFLGQECTVVQLFCLMAVARCGHLCVSAAFIIYYAERAASQSAGGRSN